MGDEGCDQVSSKLGFWFLRRKQNIYLWATSQGPVFFFSAMNKLWYIPSDEGCGKVSSKLCCFREVASVYGWTDERADG